MIRIIRVTKRTRSRCEAITHVNFSCFRIVGTTPVPIDHTWGAMNAFLTRRS